MPNISIIAKVVQKVCAIDYLLSKYTFLLINPFVQRQNFLIDEDISWMGLLSSSKECTHWPLLSCTLLFKISSIGRGPYIHTVSKIGVYETIINHFLDLICKVFRIRDIMPHDLEILCDTIDMWSFQFRWWSTIALKNFALVTLCIASLWHVFLSRHH